MSALRRRISEGSNTKIDVSRIVRSKSISSVDSHLGERSSISSVGGSSLGSLTFSDHGERDRFLSTVRTRLSVDSRKGVDYLIEKKVIDRDPKQIAKFFFEPISGGVGASKTAIGDYLGKSDAFHVTVLKEFVQLHNFKDVSFDEGLRDFLWRFRLPGEAQQIDRIMECFAEHFHASNPDVFGCKDVVYILSFSTIMLNTDLFNPSVKNKMTLASFINSHKGINNGGDVPKEILENIYYNISKNQLAIPDDEGDNYKITFFSNDKSGYLIKQGGRRKTWKKRWIVITNNCLYYFKNEEDAHPCGIVPLENLVCIRPESKTKLHCFELYSADGDVIKACKTAKNRMTKKGHHSSYIFCAASEDDCLEWMSCISNASIMNPLDMLLQQARTRVTFADS